jgi:hypothetical protein
MQLPWQVSFSQLREILSRQREGPIVYLEDSRSPSVWAKFLQMKQQDRLQHLKKMVPDDFQEEPVHRQEELTWSWRKLLNSMLGKESKRKDDKGAGKSPDSYNLYDRRPDFSNNYGWSVALDESDYDPLKHSGIGVYLVNLTAVIDSSTFLLHYNT